MGLLVITPIIGNYYHPPLPQSSPQVNSWILHTSPWPWAELLGVTFPTFALLFFMGWFLYLVILTPA